MRLNELYAKYKDHVHFYIIYIREAHPAKGWQVPNNLIEEIIFDEPTVGLDPEERLRFRDLISDLASERIIILSSHIVSDIQSIADEVAIMKDGNLIAKNSQEDIIELAKGKVFETTVNRSNIQNFKKYHTVVSSYRLQDNFRVRYLSETPHVDAQPVAVTLEDAYIYLTKN